MHFHIRRLVCVSEGALYHFGGEGVLHRLSRCHKRAVRAVVQGMVSPRGAMYLTIQVSVFYALVAVRAFCELAGLERWHAALRSASSRPEFEAEEELLDCWGEVLGVSNGCRPSWVLFGRQEDRLQMLALPAVRTHVAAAVTRVLTAVT